MLTLGLAAWGAVLAKGYNDRSRVYGWTQAMAVVGSIAILLLPLFTHGKITPGLKASMPTIGLILIIAVPIALLITTALTPEHVQPDSAAAEVQAFGLLAGAQAAIDAAPDPGRPRADARARHDGAALRLLFPRRQGVHVSPRSASC